MSGSLQTQNAFVPISYCVNLVLMDLEHYSGKLNEKILQYAILGFEDLHYTTINSVKVAYLEMDELNRVKLPNDYIDYYKIGIGVGGQVWNLGLNNSIIIPKEYECGNDAREIFINGGVPDLTSGYYYTDHYSDGGFVGGLFGIGGGFRESRYRIDTERRQILFDSPISRSEIILEYRSNGISAQTLIPREAVASIVSYVHWRRLFGKNRHSEMNNYERIWKEEVSQLRAFKYQFKASEYLDMFHAENVQTVKR